MHCANCNDARRILSKHARVHPYMKRQSVRLGKYIWPVERLGLRSPSVGVGISSTQDPYTPHEHEPTPRSDAVRAALNRCGASAACVVAPCQPRLLAPHRPSGPR
ncbi:hypothetical protein QQF64_017139 [Cirrhinus molitorella]|uniref:Uncharacterized protein n=1 Tax=Cirrhinus molitorella TaxID=172907 RepID=A0ABR3LKB0_9TELE